MTDDPLMAAVDAVELPNGDDGPAPLSRDIVQAMPPLHLLVPSILGVPPAVV
jgi:hypothetical protein